MIIIKSEEELKRMGEACRIVAEVLDLLRGTVAVGISTLEIEKVAEDAVIKAGGVPAFKGYKGYPASLCASLNDQVVHGIPSALRLKDGDILSIDLGVLYQGYYGDAATTIPVGRISAGAEKLLAVTEESLYRGIDMAIVGNRVSDISHAIQTHVERSGFSVVREFVGHGIGASLHEEPQVPNFGQPGRGDRLKEGMTLAIEPMVNFGGYKIRVLRDGWTAVTADGSLSAHFEHTVAVTKNGACVLTRTT